MNSVVFCYKSDEITINNLEWQVCLYFLPNHLISSYHLWSPIRIPNPRGISFAGCHSNRHVSAILYVGWSSVCWSSTSCPERETSAELEISILPADPERSKLVVAQNVTGVLFEDHIVAERFYVKLRLGVAIAADLELVGWCIEQLWFHQQGNPGVLRGLHQKCGLRLIQDRPM